MINGLKTIITNTILGVKKVVRSPKKDHSLSTTKMSGLFKNLFQKEGKLFRQELPQFQLRNKENLQSQ